MFATVIGAVFWIDLLLVLLVLLDIVLSVLALGLPDVWFRLFHGAPYEDPQGLLRRTGAVWVAFTVLQLIALLYWQTKPYWLVLIAGVRLTESFSDWVYVSAARHMTKLGRLALLLAPPANLIMGIYLIASYLRLTSPS